LLWKRADEQREIVVRIWEPVSWDGRFVCDFAIDGLPQPLRLSGGGLDSLDALLNAVSGIRALLEPHRDSISYLDEAGHHGIPLQVFGFGVDDGRYLEQLVETAKAFGAELLAGPGKRRISRAIERLDIAFIDCADAFSDEALVAALTDAVLKERAARESGDEDVRWFFFEQRLAFRRELAKRPNYLEAMEDLYAAGLWERPPPPDPREAARPKPWDP
jgi:hypothetical protein